MPQVASRRSSAATRSATSLAPFVSRWPTRGKSVASSATRIAPEARARARTSVKARSARATVFPARQPAERRAVPRVHAVELGAERGERHVTELVHQPAREITRDAGAMLRARVGRPVYVSLPVALAQEESLGLQPDHDRHDGGVSKLARASEVVDDVADRGRAALPEPPHDLGLERPEERPRARHPAQIRAL